MRNIQNITIEDISLSFSPRIHNTFDKITNLSDQTLGYYAFLLQESNIGMASSKNEAAIEHKDSLVIKLLSVFCCKIEEASISYTDIAFGKGRVKNYELFFRLFIQGVGYPVVLRNGFLLMVIQSAGIAKLEDIDQYYATVIFNHANVNPHICAFVRFEKENERYPC